MSRTGRAIRSGDCGAPDLSNGGQCGTTIADSTRGVARIARTFGVLYLITFVTSIPALWLYQPVAGSSRRHVAGAGQQHRILLGAFLELVLIIGNIGTAVVVYPLLKRRSEVCAVLRDRSYW